MSIELKPDSIYFLLNRLDMWEMYKAVQVIPHLPTEESQQLLEIAKEFDPSYTGTIWCQSCLEDLVKFVFINFEKTAQYQAIKAPKNNETIRIKTSFDGKA